MLHFTGAKPSSYVQPGRLIKSATGRLLREVGNKRPTFERIGTSIPRTETVRDTHIDITMLTLRNSRIGPNAVEVLSESVLMTVPTASVRTEERGNLWRLSKRVSGAAPNKANVICCRALRDGLSPPLQRGRARAGSDTRRLQRAGAWLLPRASATDPLILI
jgi:hypothetical protein